jgi:hypothetical protein
MADRDRWEIIGTEQPLGRRAVSSPSSDPRGGEWQKVGDEIDFSRRSIHSPSANPPQGTYQIMGQQIPISRTAVKGWGNAASLTMSPTCLDQSNNAAQRKGRRR